MASLSTQLSEPKKPCDINNLMSPPEAPKLESFSHSNIDNKKNGIANMYKSVETVTFDARLPGPTQPLSPPISPATKLDDNAMNGVITSTKDPILFPTHDIVHCAPQQPLFAQEPADPRRIVDRHVSTRPAELFQNATPPEQDDYELVLYFQSQVMKKFKQNPGSWLRRERALLLADRKAQARQRQVKLQPILPAKVQPVRKEVQRAKPARAPRVTKSTAAKPTPTKPRPIRAGPSPAAAAPAAAAGALARHSARAPSSTPDPSPRRGTTQTRADDNFASVPDFCPPLESLTSKMQENFYKLEWKTGTTDLSNDPNRHLLHELEVTMASSLRLSAAVYLTSKRRIFERRLECLRVGKEFRKTDAQQACKIDVNKASRLWVGFESVGWLAKSWMDKYL